MLECGWFRSLWLYIERTSHGQQRGAFGVSLAQGGNFSCSVTHPDGRAQHLEVLVDGGHRRGGVDLVDLEHLLQLVAEGRLRGGLGCVEDA